MLKSEIENFEERRQRVNAFIQENGLRVYHRRQLEFLDFGHEMTFVCLHPRHSNFVEFSVAICNPKDQYDKAIGRVLATERFQEGKTVKLPVSEFTLILNG